MNNNHTYNDEEIFNLNDHSKNKLLNVIDNLIESRNSVEHGNVNKDVDFDKTPEPRSKFKDMKLPLNDTSFYDPEGLTFPNSTLQSNLKSFNLLNSATMNNGHQFVNSGALNDDDVEEEVGTIFSEDLPNLNENDLHNVNESYLNNNSPVIENENNEDNQDIYQSSFKALSLPPSQRPSPTRTPSRPLSQSNSQSNLKKSKSSSLNSSPTSVTKRTSPFVRSSSAPVENEVSSNNNNNMRTPFKSPISHIPKSFRHRLNSTTPKVSPPKKPFSNLNNDHKNDIFNQHEEIVNENESNTSSSFSLPHVPESPHNSPAKQQTPLRPRYSFNRSFHKSSYNNDNNTTPIKDFFNKHQHNHQPPSRLKSSLKYNFNSSSNNNNGNVSKNVSFVNDNYHPSSDDDSNLNEGDDLNERVYNLDEDINNKSNTNVEDKFVENDDLNDNKHNLIVNNISVGNINEESNKDGELDKQHHNIIDYDYSSKDLDLKELERSTFNNNNNNNNSILKTPKIPGYYPFTPGKKLSTFRQSTPIKKDNEAMDHSFNLSKDEEPDKSILKTPKIPGFYPITPANNNQFKNYYRDDVDDSLEIVDESEGSIDANDNESEDKNKSDDTILLTLKDIDEALKSTADKYEKNRIKNHQQNKGHNLLNLFKHNDKTINNKRNNDMEGHEEIKNATLRTNDALNAYSNYIKNDNNGHSQNHRHQNQRINVRQRQQNLSHNNNSKSYKLSFTILLIFQLLIGFLILR